MYILMEKKMETIGIIGYILGYIIMEETMETIGIIGYILGYMLGLDKGCIIGGKVI